MNGLPAPVDVAAIRARSARSRRAPTVTRGGLPVTTGTCDDADALCGEVEQLRALLARVIDHIDPNDRHEDFLLLVECEDALRAAAGRSPEPALEHLRIGE